jgi:hypothetical protein
VLLLALVFTGVWAALWDTPEADLSLARLHITDAGYIQNRPKFSVYLSGLSTLIYLYLEDTVARTRSLPIIRGYPQAQVAARLGKFELGLSGEQTLDAGGRIWEKDSLDVSRSLDIYRLSAEAAWWPSQKIGLVLGYNHYLGWLSWEEKDSKLEAFGDAPGVSVGLVFAPSDRLKLNEALLFPLTPLHLTGSISNNGDIKTSISLPQTVLTDISIRATESFDAFITLRYAFTSSTDSLYIDLPLDYAGSISTVPLYERNTLAVQLGAGYRVIAPLTLRLWGKYSSSPVDELRLAWPDPADIGLTAQAIWTQGVWRFSAEVGTQRFQPIVSQGLLLEGNSYHLRIGVGLAI